MEYLVGILIGIFASIVANLLTPFMKPLWGKFMALWVWGHRAQLGQQIKVLQAQLDQLNRFKASERDLYLYLFRWLLGIISIFAAALPCGVIGFANSQPPLIMAALVLLFFAAIATLVLLSSCNNLTTDGMEEKTVWVRNKIAQHRAKVPDR
jgi:hypothetical protein